MADTTPRVGEKIHRYKTHTKLMVFSTFRAWTPPSEGHVLSGWSQSATSSSAKCTPGSSWPTWGRQATLYLSTKSWWNADELDLLSGKWWIYPHKSCEFFILWAQCIDFVWQNQAQVDASKWADSVLWTLFQAHRKTLDLWRKITKWCFGSCHMPKS